MLVIDQVVKRYGELVAVNNISFEIKRGECLGLLGPNGAGKSTTISMMVGLLKPDSGTVRLDGASPDSNATRRLIGVAPQALSLYEELTPRENLTFFGKLYGLSAAKLRDRVAWALKIAGLEDRARHRVHTFSGGMKRRLNIAVALIHQPTLLLLDEPTVGVDPQSRNHIFDWIEQLKADGMTIVYTTHYMEEAQRLCDRVAIIDHGKLLALDAIPQLLAQHGGQSVISGRLKHIPSDFSLPGTLLESDWRLESEQPFDVLMRLAQSGVRFGSVQIAGPDLEAVFLKLTGRVLRD
jgi:ABC-2 type transport system ATP-binding protein